TAPYPPYWPIYNNPEVGGKKKYPNAGVRVPSPLTLFNFYMHPSFIDGDQTKPLILPYVKQPIRKGCWSAPIRQGHGATIWQLHSIPTGQLSYVCLVFTDTEGV